MNIKKCDICKKEIGDKTNKTTVSFRYEWFDICEICFLPVIKFLQKNKLIDKNNKRIEKL